ncbi:hypothetical protein [Paracoccus luteus]|uniref:hypothetical protein n=1 Tax=Paracoccus luteus TaxID=2508543 RepID=UPI001FE31F66|nr:hypothetical protein [Paracoccus luteus]
MSRTAPNRTAARALLIVCAAALAVSGCGRGDSGWNPRTWFGGSGAARGPQTLEPRQGYGREDPREPVAQILSARWEPLVEGRLLVVTAIPPTKGWWNAALLTETPQPEGQLRADPDGVLRLRLVASPPLRDSRAAAMAAQPAADTLTAAVAVSHAELAGIASVTVAGATNAITLGN